ncbi:hypothetical protein TRVA0_023S00496 [Trichomonascus vanleenenianus]|uniref:uncharacterized protein n=1 Tax=Trichomonascus vanleenenianus TaxID=2268995 RepID=UPI003ECB723F
MDIPPLSNAPLQISTSALISTLHQTFTNTQYRALRIDSTSVLYLGPNIEEAFISTLWEHAYKRAEDQALLITPTHAASTTVFFSAVSAFPNANPAVGQALNVLTPFLTALTPKNISTRYHNGIAVYFSLNSKGDVVSSRISLPEEPFTSLDQLIRLPSEAGNRVFDVFYHLLLAESERAEHLSLKQPDQYDLLKRSGTYSLPEWVAFSDDYALAKDWSDGLRQCGIKGASLRGLLATLSGILLLGNESSQEDQEEGCALLGIDPNLLKTHSVEQLITSAYTCLVENVAAELNHFLSAFDLKTHDSAEKKDEDGISEIEDDPNEVIAVVSVVECSSNSKQTILKNVFDNSTGINSELREDGIALPKTPSNVSRALRTMSTMSTGSGSMTLGSARPTSKIFDSFIPNFRGHLDADVSYLAKIREPTEANRPELLSIEDLAASSRIWNVLNLAACATAEDQARDVWSSSLVSSEIREFFVTEWATKRRLIDFTADFGLEEFLERFSPVLPPNVGFYELEAWARGERNWAPQEFFCGSSRVWLAEHIWHELEYSLQALDEPQMDPFASNGMPLMAATTPGAHTDYDSVQYPPEEYSASHYDGQSNRLLGDYQGQPQLHQPNHAGMGGSSPSIVTTGTGGATAAAAAAAAAAAIGAGGVVGGQMAGNVPNQSMSGVTLGANNDPYSNDKQIPPPGSNMHGHIYNDSDDEDDNPFNEDMMQKFKNDVELNGGQRNAKVEVVQMDRQRKVWVWFVWLLTFWIPSPFLRFILGMKRSDVRMAWREKLVICFIITLINAAIIFYMIFLGKFICPDYDKVWSLKQVGTHMGENDFYVAIHGSVYDITKFYRQQHSDIAIKTTSATMLEFAGQDLTGYFPPPLYIACPGLVNDYQVQLTLNSTQFPLSEGMHVSGNNSAYIQSALYKESWYKSTFQPKIKQYYIGRVVTTKGDVKKGPESNDNLYWGIIDGHVYDISAYMATVANMDPSVNPIFKKWNFFDDKIVNLFQNYNGLDITEEFYGPDIDPTLRANTLECLKNAFDAGDVDFRNSPRCQVANYILLIMAGILTSVTVVKFLASLRFGGKKNPSPQNKFVVCQIPAYTESEDDLRLAIDSLTSLKYPNKQKLLFVICDGMIVGSGNDRPTPRIVLDLFGVDDKVDPQAKAYLAIGEGSNRLNYGKVYSGLYEHEGNLVPYIVVVKVGRPNETRRPGNRGKRDSQIMLMNFFNHVHYQAPMSPLELEIFHHMNNIIGVDPELYEYLFMVDADTSVSDDALTRLVAVCTNDSKIAGTCGETSLQNEEKSWATMIQVYEYFISHHLTKAFESLFGTVTCLPGCFSLYRLRTAKKSKPLIISNEVIKEYSVCHVDTLHKKNLFSLGEDRYLTTLITKHFPKMKLTFVPDANAQTAAPEEFKVLLSQRRRWINSTVHNLTELLRINNMCGFCCFGMRGVVFIDLVGTVMLPSVVVYLGYLIYKIAAHDGPLPLISIILIAAVYGLQALVFILRRQWQHIGWMIIYVAAYPIHSFLLPIYSFWNMDNFSWGNTRIVVGEKGGKQLVSIDDEGFDPSSVEMETWRSYAIRSGLRGAERSIIFDDRKGRLVNQVYDDGELGYDMQEFGPGTRRQTLFDADQMSRMDGSQSVYSEARTRSYSTFTMDTPFNASRGSLLGGGTQYSQSRLSMAHPMPSMPSRLSMAPSATNFMPPSEGLHAELYDESRDAQISETIRQVLATADFENMTKRQLREKVEDIMGVRFPPDKVPLVDGLIDDELEKFDEDEDEEEAEPIGKRYSTGSSQRLSLIDINPGQIRQVSQIGNDEETGGSMPSLPASPNEQHQSPRSPPPPPHD